MNDITCHPVLPLLLTTSHHNLPEDAPICESPTCDDPAAATVSTFAVFNRKQDDLILTAYSKSKIYESDKKNSRRHEAVHAAQAVLVTVNTFACTVGSWVRDGVLNGV